MSAYERCCRVQPWVAFVTDTGIGAEKARQGAEQRGQAAFPVRHTRIEQVCKRLQ
ncbi:hypothetical protein D3C76_1865330 [compost metagenome]